VPARGRWHELRKLTRGRKSDTPRQRHRADPMQTGLTPWAQLGQTREALGGMSTRWHEHLAQDAAPGSWSLSGCHDELAAAVARVCFNELINETKL